MSRLVVCGMLQLVGLLVLMACNPNNVLVSEEQRETEQAQATARVETVVYSGTQVGTVVALQATADGAPVMQTQLAQLERENQELELTVEAIETRGVPVGLRITQSPQGPMPTMTQVARYMDLRTANSIDPDTGCATDRRWTFFGRGQHHLSDSGWAVDSRGQRTSYALGTWRATCGMNPASGFLKRVFRKFASTSG